MVVIFLLCRNSPFGEFREICIVSIHPRRSRCGPTYSHIFKTEFLGLFRCFAWRQNKRWLVFIFTCILSYTLTIECFAGECGTRIRYFEVKIHVWIGCLFRQISVKDYPCRRFLRFSIRSYIWKDYTKCKKAPCII